MTVRELFSQVRYLLSDTELQQSYGDERLAAIATRALRRIGGDHHECLYVSAVVTTDPATLSVDHTDLNASLPIRDDWLDPFAHWMVSTILIEDGDDEFNAKLSQYHTGRYKELSGS